MPVYATLDADTDGSIHLNADIYRFGSVIEARAWLLAPYDPAEWNLAAAKIGPGRFGDCWIRTIDPVRVGASLLNPFTYTQVRVARPGQHPGGRDYWVTPAVDVLTVTYIEEA